jgi:uncharacterized membrane protein YheB (UPF0754 family)
MALTTEVWISVPILGGVIGYVTNAVAVRMIFRPVRARRILGLRWQGLIGRRQNELAASIGRVVGDHLVRHEDIVGVLAGLDLEALIGKVIDRALETKLAGLRRVPLLGSLLTPQRVADLRGALVRGFLEDKEELFAEIERALQQGLDVQAIVAEKVSAFPVERLEELVMEVSRKELRAIEVLGGVLGFLVGLLQVGVLALF